MRRSLTPKQRLDMLNKQGGRCALCLAPLHPSRTIAEHSHPVSLGNSERPDCLLCRVCADRKTNGTPATTYGSDSHAISKAKRLARKEAGTWREPKAKIRSAGFDSRFKRKFNGEVIWKKT